MVMCPDLLQTELFTKIVLGFSLFSRHVVSVETRPNRRFSMVQTHSVDGRIAAI